MNSLQGKNIAILATDGFEQVELFEPKKALEEAGAKTKVISIHDGNIMAWNKDTWGETVPVDQVVKDTNISDFHGLLLPGGVMNPDKLRMDSGAVKFVKSFFEQDKPVAAICHGPWMLVEAGVLKDRKVTSWPSLKTDITNAGGNWVDEEVVVDQGLVTSRKPEDIPAFTKKMIEEFAEGKHDEQSESVQ